MAHYETAQGADCRRYLSLYHFTALTLAACSDVFLPSVSFVLPHLPADRRMGGFRLVHMYIEASHCMVVC